MEKKESHVFFFFFFLGGRLRKNTKGRENEIKGFERIRCE